MDGAIISVVSDTVHEDLDEGHDQALKEGHPIEQSDKPRAGSKHRVNHPRHYTEFLTSFLTVAAEYLAKGYALSDSILERAIEIDSKTCPYDLITFYQPFLS